MAGSCNAAAPDGIALAFDHANILADAIERTRGKLEYTTLATRFCRPEFTIADLRRVYEAVWNTRLDAANFQRKILASTNVLISTDGHSEPHAQGGRPARLHRAGSASTLTPPMLRPPAATTDVSEASR